jgi:hypothetical protein
MFSDNGEGFKCILSLNNTIINNQTEVNYYQLGFLSSGAPLQLDIFPIPINHMHFELSPLPYGGLLVEYYHKDTAELLALQHKKALEIPQEPEKVYGRACKKIF